MKMCKCLEQQTKGSCHCREALLRLRSENAQLRGLLKEQTSTEWKEKESADASGNSSDVQAESKKVGERPHDKSKVLDPSKVSHGKTPGTSGLIVSSTEWMESPEMKGQSHRKRLKQHVVRHGVGLHYECKNKIIQFIKVDC